MRLIDADALLKQMGYNFKQASRDGCDHPIFPVVEETIMEAPTIEPDSLRPKGRWEWKHRRRGGFRKRKGITYTGEELEVTIDDRYEIDDPYCSVCGKFNESVFLNYCPSCGAQMEKEVTENERMD